MGPARPPGLEDGGAGGSAPAMRALVAARAVAEVIRRAAGEPAIIATPAHGRLGGAASERSDQRGIVRNHGDGVALGDLANWQQPEEKRDG